MMRDRGEPGGPHGGEDRDEFGELRYLVPVGGDEAHHREADQHRAQNGKDGGHAARGRTLLRRFQDLFGIGGRDPAAFDPEIEVALQLVEIGALPHGMSRFFFRGANMTGGLGLNQGARDYPAAEGEVKAGPASAPGKGRFPRFACISLSYAAECRIISCGRWPVRFGEAAAAGPVSLGFGFRPDTGGDAMNVATILKAKGSDVATVNPTVTLGEVATLLSERRIGAVVVMQDRKVLGIVSERDIVKAVARNGGEALTAPVRDVMTSRVVTCSLNDSVDELMDSMTMGRFRHLPVIEDGELAGIISIGDVVKHRIAETVMETEAMRLYIANG
jgi:CBS domain-containing protein